MTYVDVSLFNKHISIVTGNGGQQTRINNRMSYCSWWVLLIITWRKHLIDIIIIIGGNPQCENNTHLFSFHNIAMPNIVWFSFTDEQEFAYHIIYFM